MNATYKKMVKMAMTTVMAGGIMMMGQSAMAAPAQPQVHVDSATKDMPGHVASKVLDVKADKTEVGLISNVVYEQVPSRGYANVPMQMDILQPKTKEKKPAILFVTGGGFINANKDNGIQLRMHLAENGYVVGSINYRVAPTAKFPEPLEDVKAAIRYLKANADRFGIDPARVGIVGGSAGGYLTAMAGTTSGTKTFDKGEISRSRAMLRPLSTSTGSPTSRRLAPTSPKKSRQSTALLARQKPSGSTARLSSAAVTEASSPTSRQPRRPTPSTTSARRAPRCS